MTDIATETPAVEPTTEVAEKPTKTPKQPVPCTCSRFLLVDEKADNAEFDTECSATTMRTFAQGHDARLVSFLVQGEFDGLRVDELRDGVRYNYNGAAHAAATISEALGAKAEAAIGRLKAAGEAKAAKQAERDQAREAKAAEKAQKAEAAAKAKAEKAEAAAQAKAAKATAGPREVGANVVPGSVVTDGPREGLIRIKVGKGEYDAEVSEVDNGEGGTKQIVTYTNLRGEEETRDLDLVRVLTNA